MRIKRPWFHKYILSALRRIWRWSPERKATYDKVKCGIDKYRCEKCNKVFSRKKKQVAVDHISPVVSTKEGFKTWDDYISRLYCSKEGLQVLCTSCHSRKSQSENKERHKLNAK